MIAFVNLGVISMISVVTWTIAKILVDVFGDFNGDFGDYLRHHCVFSRVYELVATL